jgi:hypothetical protein
MAGKRNVTGRTIEEARASHDEVNRLVPEADIRVVAGMVDAVNRAKIALADNRAAYLGRERALLESLGIAGRTVEEHVGSLARARGLDPARVTLDLATRAFRQRDEPAAG